MSDSLDHGGKDRWSVFDCQEKDQAYGQIASTLVAGKGEGFGETAETGVIPRMISSRPDE